MDALGDILNTSIVFEFLKETGLAIKLNGYREAVAVNFMGLPSLCHEFKPRLRPFRERTSRAG
jgi:hypothetical protein